MTATDTGETRHYRAAKACPDRGRDGNRDLFRLLFQRNFFGHGDYKMAIKYEFKSLDELAKFYFAKSIEAEHKATLTTGINAKLMKREAVTFRIVAVMLRDTIIRG